ncbi:MAG: hypothetical protein FWF18_03565 [Dehalococcoidia bacterium]|nr:hypothetical protein [Dehalococcoidia bacterium]
MKKVLLVGLAALVLMCGSVLAGCSTTVTTTVPITVNETTTATTTTTVSTTIPTTVSTTVTSTTTAPPVTVTTTVDNSVDNFLAYYAAMTNAAFPMMFGSELRVDGCEVLPGRTLQYTYTLMTYTRDAISADELALLRTLFYLMMLNEIQNSNEFEVFNGMAVTYEYVFKSSDSFELFTVTITPQDYR